MPKFGISAGLPDTPSGLEDKDYGLVAPLYRALGSIAQFLSSVTGNIQYEPSEMAQADQLTKLIDNKLQKVFVQAAVTLNYGVAVSLSISGGKLVGDLADATDLTKPAFGICDVPGGIPAGSYGEIVFMKGRTLGVSGTTFGAAYYLSTAGNVQITPPVSTGVINQIVGIGLGSAGLYVNIEPIGKRVALVYKQSASVLRVLYTDGSFTDNSV